MEFEINHIKRDDFGRAHGIIAVNKPAGITSHDAVYAARKALGTKKVGHAGALDPFATGVLLLLVGKATTMADSFINSDKEYVMTMLFGISTNSADTEGEVMDIQEVKEQPQLGQVLGQFTPEYEQYVPVFSSVKIEGQKLRVLARKFDSFELVDQQDGRYVRFSNNDNDSEKLVKLPKHLCRIPEIEVLSQEMVDIDTTELRDRELPYRQFPTAKVRVACSKGTYIRTLAEDIGKALTPPLPAMLINLERTRVGNVSISQAISLDDLGNL